MMHSPSEDFEWQESNAVGEIHELKTLSPGLEGLLNKHIMAGPEKGYVIGVRWRRLIGMCFLYPERLCEHSWLGCVSSRNSSGSHPMEGTKTGVSFRKFLWAVTLSNTVSLIKGSLSIRVTLLLVFMLAVPRRAYLSKSFCPDSWSSTLTMCASAPGLGVEYNQPWAKFPISWITKECNLLACFSLCSPSPPLLQRKLIFRLRRGENALGLFLELSWHAPCDPRGLLRSEWGHSRTLGKMTSSKRNHYSN